VANIPPQHDFTLTPDSEEIGLKVNRRWAARPTSEDMPEFDSEARHADLAAALAFRGHLREAYQVMSRFPGLMAWGTFTGLALAGIVPPDIADAIFGREPQERPSGAAAVFRVRLGFPLPWWAARRDTSALKRHTERLRARKESEPLPQDRYLLGASEAYLALARGDTLEAVARLQALPASAGLVWYERLTLARLLAALGRDREALAVLDRGFPWTYQALERAPWALERARLAERLGDREKAKYWYGYVAKVWRHADPELRPYLVEAQAALGRLTAEAGA